MLECYSVLQGPIFQASPHQPPHIQAPLLSSTFGNFLDYEENRSQLKLEIELGLYTQYSLQFKSLQQ